MTRHTLTDMKDRPELTELIQKSVAAFKVMSKKEQESVINEQSESWARQDKD